MNRILKYIVLPFLIASACQQLPSEEKKLYEEVMFIHDEVMPKTKNIYRKSKALKSMVSEKTDNMKNKQISKVLDQLDQADKAMFDWMAAFKKKNDFEEGYDYQAYLASEKIRIQAVADAMNSSLANAEQFINDHQNE